MKLPNRRKKMMRPLRRSRQGFTLLELLLVMAILVVLAGLASFAVLKIQKNAYSGAAGTEISTLSNACQMYKIHVGAFPTKLADLTTRPNGLDNTSWGGPYLKEAITSDPWNRPYKYSPDDLNDTVLIQSAGPDGQSGSEDDVSNAPAT